MNSLDDIYAAAQSLPSSDRARLIAMLWDDMSEDQWPPPSEEWIREAQRRSEAIEKGQMTLSNWDAARERARRAAGLDE